MLFTPHFSNELVHTSFPLSVRLFQVSTEHLLTCAMIGIGEDRGVLQI
jgi:hypothetical protein